MARRAKSTPLGDRPDRDCCVAKEMLPSLDALTDDVLMGRHTGMLLKSTDERVQLQLHSCSNLDEMKVASEVIVDVIARFRDLAP
jgi:hypothetical protein